MVKSIDYERLRRENCLTKKSPSTLKSWLEVLNTYPKEKKLRLNLPLIMVKTLDIIILYFK